jgi:hypothetical protein
MLHRPREGTTTGTSNDPGCCQPEPQEDRVPRDERIGSIGLLTRRDIGVLGIGFQRMFPLQDNVIPDAIDFPRAALCADITTC